MSTGTYPGVPANACALFFRLHQPSISTKLHGTILKRQMPAATNAELLVGSISAVSVEEVLRDCPGDETYMCFVAPCTFQ